jgi:gliding motility-associated-like protein
MVLGFRRYFCLLLFWLFFCLGKVNAQYNSYASANSLGGDCYQLTPNLSDQIGSLWSANQLDLSSPFNIEFKILFGNNDAGGDGVCFVFQNNGGNSLPGGGGGGLGYQGGSFTQSLAVEFDTYANLGGTVNDINEDHIAIISNGIVDHNAPTSLSPAVAATLIPSNIEDGLYHNVRLSWNPSTTIFEVFFDCDLRISINEDIIDDIFSGNAMVYFGFTASGGQASNAQEICIVPYPFLNLPVEICENQTINLFSSDGDSHSWSGPAGFTSVQQNLVITNATTAMSGNYSVEVTNPTSSNCNFSNIENTAVTVNSLPTATVSGTTQVCKNSVNPAVTFTGSNGLAPYTFTYSINGGLNQTITTSIGNTIDLQVPTSESGTFTYTLFGVQDNTSTLCQQLQNGSVEITVTETPNATINYASGYCATNSNSQSVLLTGDIGGIFSSLPAGLSLNNATGAINPSTSSIGDYTVTYTIPPFGGCSVFTTADMVSIDPSPTATISYPLPLCNNNLINQIPEIFGYTNGLFTSAPMGLIIDENTGLINPGLSNPGNYTINYDIAAANGCAAFNTFTNIEVNAAPVASIDYQDAFCSSNPNFQSPILSGASGGVYSCSPSGISINTFTGAITPNNSAVGDFIILYTIPAFNGCETVIASDEVSIFLSPTASVVYSSPFCSSDPNFQLPSLNGTTGGIFSSSPAGLIIDEVTGKITPNSSSAGIYIVSYTIAGTGGCIDFIETSNVTIFESPSASIFYQTPVCSSNPNFQSPIVSGSSGGLYSASPLGLAINSLTGEITPNASLVGTYIVSYSIPAAAGCIAFSTGFNFSIFPAPTATISYEPLYCTNNSTLQNTQLVGELGGIYSCSSLGLSLNDSTGSILPSASILGDYTITYTLAATEGCAEFTTSFNTSIVPLQNADFSYSDDIFCSSGINPIPIINGVLGGSFSSFPAGLIFQNAGGEIDLSASEVGVYDITYVTNGPCENSSFRTITISTPPNAAFNYSASTFCDNEVNPLPVYESYTLAGLFSSVPMGLELNSSTGEIILSESSKGDFIITNTISANGGCATEVESTNVTIMSTPIVNFTADFQSACAPSSIIFVNESVIASGNISSLNWNFSDGVSNLTNPTHYFENDGNYTISLTATAGNGCTTTLVKPDFIEIYPTPTANFSSTNQASILYPVIEFTDNSLGADSWLWNFDEITDNSNFSNLQNPTYSFSKIGTYCPELIAFNNYGCSDSITNCLEITPEYSFYIPNAFTPNGDGLNDIFKPESTDLDWYYFEIINRFGEVIFSSDNIKKGWDGSVNGYFVEPDVYTWRIKAKPTNGIVFEKFGAVVVLR